jgi:hypothetical protein
MSEEGFSEYEKRRDSMNRIRGVLLRRPHLIPCLLVVVLLMGAVGSESSRTNREKGTRMERRAGVRYLAKTLIWGVLLVLGACWFWYSLIGNPIDELALIRRAQIAPGSLVETREHEAEDDRGHVYSSDVGVYSFRVPDGREFNTMTGAPTGELQETVSIEYLPDDPAVNRVKGDGCESVLEWLWRKVGLGLLLLALFVRPGVGLLLQAVRDMRRLPNARSRP